MSEYPNDPPESSINPSLPGPEGLLFTGDAIRALSPDQIAAIGDFSSRMFGVELRQIPTVSDTGTRPSESEQSEEDIEREPVPATLDDFRQFAAANGYSYRRAVNAWNLVMFADGQDHLRGSSEFPAIRFIGPAPDEIAHADVIVDLLSIKERLAFSSSKAVWWGTEGVSDKTIAFLRQMSDAQLQEP